MPQVWLPTITNSPPLAPPPAQRVVIDPITRIEGHLRIEVQVKNGVVTDAQFRDKNTPFYLVTGWSQAWSIR
jgi:hypothetical protein